MSRDDGFPIADIDSSYYEDAKWREAWQTLRDPERMALAVCLHHSTLLSSWRHGERITVRQGAPLWLLVDDDLVTLLQACDLLDDECRIPEASWDVWFGAAYARREARRDSGRRGGQASPKPRSSVASPTLEDRPSVPQPVRPSVRPSDKPTEHAREDDDGRPDLDAFLAVRYRPPTPAQRALMDAYKDVFNVTGPARAADLIYRHPDDPIGALKADLAAFRKERAAQVIPEPTPPKRKGSGMAHISGVSSEWREHMAAQARLEDDHFAGRHHEPVAACPKCGTVAA